MGPANDEIVHVPDAQGPRRASLEECFAHTDLEWRLKEIPEWACTRGLYFAMLDQAAGRLSEATQREYRSFFRIYKFVPFRMYPTSDYLTRLIVLAQIHWGSDRIFEGVRTLQSSAFDAYSATLMGKAALAVVQPRLETLLRFISLQWAAQLPANYSQFSILESRPRQHRFRLENEYVYIEHAMVGAVEGLARLCDARVEVTCELTGKFNGIITVREV